MIWRGNLIIAPFAACGFRRRLGTGKSLSFVSGKAMLIFLRFFSFLLGGALVGAPAFLALAFAYGVGEPPETAGAFAFYLMPLAVGLIFGLGPLFVGFPSLVAGPKTPNMRVTAGALLAISMAGLLIVGFGGSVTRVAVPIALLFEVALFAVFIWPAKHFAANSPLNTGAPRDDGAPVS